MNINCTRCLLGRRCDAGEILEKKASERNLQGAFLFQNLSKQEYTQLKEVGQIAVGSQSEWELLLYLFALLVSLFFVSFAERKLEKTLLLGLAASELNYKLMNVV